MMISMVGSSWREQLNMRHHARCFTSESCHGVKYGGGGRKKYLRTFSKSHRRREGGGQLTVSPVLRKCVKRKIILQPSHTYNPGRNTKHALHLLLHLLNSDAQLCLHVCEEMHL